MPNAHFQDSFAEVVVERCIGDSEKLRELVPPPQQIAIGLPSPELGSTFFSSSSCFSHDSSCCITGPLSHW